MVYHKPVAVFHILSYVHEQSLPVAVDEPHVPAPEPAVVEELIINRKNI